MRTSHRMGWAGVVAALTLGSGCVSGELAPQPRGEGGAVGSLSPSGGREAVDDTETPGASAQGGEASRSEPGDDDDDHAAIGGDSSQRGKPDGSDDDTIPNDVDGTGSGGGGRKQEGGANTGGDDGLPDAGGLGGAPGTGGVAHSGGNGTTTGANGGATGGSQATTGGTGGGATGGSQATTGGTEEATGGTGESAGGTGGAPGGTGGSTGGASQAGANGVAGDAGSAGIAGAAGSPTCEVPEGAACSHSPSCGCEAGDVCAVDVASRSLQCQPTKDLAEGRACTGVADCAPGLGCFGGICHRCCDNDADCPSVEGVSHCSPTTWGDSTLIDGVQICQRLCDPAHPQNPNAPFLPCPAGFSCQATPDGLSACRPAGNGGYMDDCSTDSNCGAGFVCRSQVWCDRYCLSNADCTAGVGTCTAFSTRRYTGNTQVGWCYP